MLSSTPSVVLSRLTPGLVERIYAGCATTMCAGAWVDVAPIALIAASSRKTAGAVRRGREVEGGMGASSMKGGEVLSIFVSLDEIQFSLFPTPCESASSADWRIDSSADCAEGRRWHGLVSSKRHLSCMPPPGVGSSTGMADSKARV